MRMLLARKGLGIYGNSSTKQYVMVNSLPAPVGAATMLGNTVGVRNGMYVSTQLLTTPNGFTYTLGANGVPLYNSGGSMARQQVLENIWDPVTREWGTQILDYVNNGAPVAAQNQNLDLFYTRNVAITPLDLNIYRQDPEGDPTVITVLSGAWPTGFNYADPILSGTPTVATGAIPVPVTMDFADIAGGHLQLTFQVTVADLAVTIPNVVGLTQLNATTILNAAGFTVTSNAPGDSLIVKSQTPAAGSIVTAPSNVFLDTLPSGGGGGGGGASQHRNVGGLR